MYLINSNLTSAHPMLMIFLKKRILTQFLLLRPILHMPNFVIKALKANKNVFVEKPLAINQEQLKSIIETKAEFP
jgi:hypothetical protein